MKCGYDKEQLTRLLHGELSEEEQIAVETHLAQCNECRREWEGLREVWGMLDDVDVPGPSADAQIHFEAMLDSYKGSVRSGKYEGAGWWSRLRELFGGHPAFAVGYSLLLVVAGLGFGYGLHRPSPTVDPGNNKKELTALTTQVSEMREMMMKSLLQNPSASERMRGVSYTSEIRTVNKGV
ncbi:MAG TPA: zf-HC2 domain-containing protein, partial [Puia sp.]